MCLELNRMNDNESHKKRMKGVKQKVEDQVASATEDKGLVIVLTGDGKGKSSSGFGMILRALGHGMKVGVVQFIKGKWKTGEQLFFQKHPDVEYFSMGQGFTWNTQDKEGDIERTRKCWEKASEMILNPEIQVVLVDELNVVLSFDYLPVSEVLSVLKRKPESKHVIITGRGAPEEILQIADTVSVIESPKHAFENGIRAQKGIEF